MRIGVLTSSRADYGIYRPLLRALKDDPFFQYSIIAFGTHLSPQYGKTIDRILEDGFDVRHTISAMLQGDDANAIASAAALTSLKFADFWKTHGGEYDLVFCLGDRYEMFGAVVAGIPFGIKFAHLHGGETTLGAIDNVYRHGITHASVLHFTSAQAHAERVEALIGNKHGVYNCGALSLDNLKETEILANDTFLKNWSIDLSIPSVLVTIHPETVQAEQNQAFAQEVRSALTNLVNRYQLIFTMPNADTAGSVWRKLFEDIAAAHRGRAFAIESFGTPGYFTAMKKCSFLLGNTSSGIIEAASFGKYAINIGDRQKGRVAGENVIHVPFSAAKILDAVVEASGTYHGPNPYFRGGAVDIILKALKQYQSNSNS